MGHMSHVMCHMSPVQCHMLPVTCNFFVYKVVELVGERCVFNVGLLPYTNQYLRYRIVVAIFSTSTNTEAQYSLGLYIVVYSATVGNLTRNSYLLYWCVQNIINSPNSEQQFPFLADPGEARGCSTNTSVIQSIIVCENIFTAPPRPSGWKWGFQSQNRLCYNF